jgi:hypothetical protein
LNKVPHEKQEGEMPDNALRGSTSRRILGTLIVAAAPWLAGPGWAACPDTTYYRGMSRSLLKSGRSGGVLRLSYDRVESQRRML